MKKVCFASALFVAILGCAAFGGGVSSSENLKKAYVRLHTSTQAGAHSLAVFGKKATPVASKGVGSGFFAVLDKAQQGDLNAQFEVGRMYAEGDGIEQNYTKAAEWYQKAALRRHAMAQNNLGDLYREGKGVRQNFGKAVELYEKAAARNNEYALYNLGMMYEHGEGVGRDLDKAREYYEKALARGHEDAQAALANLGSSKQGGSRPNTSSKGSSSRANAKPKSPSTSSSKKSASSTQKNSQSVGSGFFAVLDKANRGDVNAQFEVGRMYADGEGIEQNYTKAAEWYQKAALRKHDMAQNNLGDLYREGKGVRQNLGKAVELYEKAAARNNEYALYNLGMMYEHGTGVWQDIEKAREYYEKAAAHGHEEAREALARVGGLPDDKQPKVASIPPQPEVIPKPEPEKPAPPAPEPKKPAAPSRKTEKPAAPAPAPAKPAAPAKKSGSDEESRPKPRLAVREFEDRSEEGQAPAAAITDMMITELMKTDEFTVMLRGKRFDDYIGTEIAMGQSGLVDAKTAPAIGKLKGLQYTMTGSITLYYYSEKGSGIALPILGMATQAKTAYVVIDLMIIDNVTGEIIYANNQYGEAKQVSKGAAASYKGFFIGGYKRREGGILAEATRNAVIKHVAAIQALDL